MSGLPKGERIKEEKLALAAKLGGFSWGGGRLLKYLQVVFFFFLYSHAQEDNTLPARPAVMEDAGVEIRPPGQQEAPSAHIRPSICSHNVTNAS